MLIDFADLFQNPPDPVEVLQLLTDLGDLGGMEADLAVLRARVVDVEDPLGMAAAAGALGAAVGVEGGAMEQRAAQEVSQRRELGEEAVGLGGAFLCHPYR